MKLEDQVCSLDLAKKLKELGVKQDSLWYRVYWERIGVDKNLGDEDEWILRQNHGVNRDAVSAYTVAELGELLPRKYEMAVFHRKNIPSNNEYKHSFIIGGSKKEYRQRQPKHGVVYEDTQDEYWSLYSFASSNVCHVQEAGKCFEADTEADVRAKMLIYLLENKII